MQAIMQEPLRFEFPNMTVDGPKIALFAPIFQRVAFEPPGFGKNVIGLKYFFPFLHLE
jgi:hypothetical protein